MQRHKPLDPWEIVPRRPLSREEVARLEADWQREPDQRRRWEDETALTHLLQGLPDSPLPSNFNARVLAAIDRLDEAPAQTRVDWRRWLLPRPVPAAAVALAMLLLGWGGRAWLRDYHRERMAASVVDVTRSVGAASLVAQVPPVEIFQDFEAIQRLSQTRLLADEDLLAALE
jgi:hypothetical protein